MNNRTDQQLLRDYADHRSEPAFTELVQRYIDLVYSAAFRMTGEAHSAKDVTQAVFLALAQSASKLTHHPVLSGWLHTTARNLAAKNVRTTVRRQNHEQEAAAMNQLLSTAPDASWEEIAPHLDAALGELSEPDRDVVLLRYFQKKTAAEIAHVLGVSDEAAQKRVTRAVERLRRFFAERGITVGASGLVVAISANAVQAAPVGLAVTISTATVLMGATLATATKAIAMTSLPKTLVTATVVVLAGVGIYEACQVVRLHKQIETLQQRELRMGGALEQLQKERDEAAAKLVALVENDERQSRNFAELLKLRGEVGVLRRQAEELRNANQQVYQAQSNSTTVLNPAKSPTVAKVLITRIKQPLTVSDELILTNITSKAGDHLERALVDADVRRLYGTGWFSNVRVAESTSSGEITLNYVLQEKPKLAEIRFAGNSRFDEHALASLVSSKIGQRLDERMLFTDVQKIQDLYTHSGFPSPKVKTLSKVNEDIGEGAAVFEIVE